MRIIRRPIIAGAMLLLSVLVNTPAAHAGIEVQACCRPNQPCIDLPPENCNGQGQFPLGEKTTCQADGHRCNVPTVSTWGMMILTVLLLIAATLMLRYRRRALFGVPLFVAGILGLFASQPAVAQTNYPAVKIQDVNGDGNRVIVLNPHGRATPLRQHKQEKGPRRASREGAPNHEVESVSAKKPVSDDSWTPPEDMSQILTNRARAGGGLGEVQVLGVQIQYGVHGVVPVRLESKLTADPEYSPRFGGNNLVSQTIEQVNFGDSTGELVFKAIAAFDADNADADNNHWTGPDFYREVLSDSSNAIVAIDGDNINQLIAQKGAYPPFNGQVPISAILNDYIDEDGNVYLDQNRVLVLFEFSPNLNSNAADFQDAVIVIDLEGIVQAADYYHPDQAIGSPVIVGTAPWSNANAFVWSFIRTAPGASRIKGLVYARSVFTDLQVGTDYIHACVTTPDSAHTSWQDCVQRTVYTRPYQAGDTQIRMADMAMTEAGRHAIGWIETDGSSNLVEYKVSFTQDHGDTWSAPVTLGSYTSSGNFAPYDLDLATNEEGDIGILTYYRQEAGSNPSEPDTLVLYIYDSKLIQTKKTIASSVSAERARFQPNCKSYCFALTGDTNDSFHAFYYLGTTPNIQARVATVIASAAGTVTQRPIGMNLTAYPAVGAARTAGGAAFVRWTTGNKGLYDIPTDPNGSPISLRSTSFTLNGDLDDSEYGLTVLTSNAAQGEANSGTMFAAKVNQAGTEIINSPINDGQIVPFCAADTPKVLNSDWCYRYQVRDVNGLGGTVIGNIYYSSSMLTILNWNGSQYVADHQKIAIHQTSMVP